MAQADMQLTINKLKNYLDNLNITSSRQTTKQFLNALNKYLKACGQILPQIKQSGQVHSHILENQLVFETDNFLLEAGKLENVIPAEAKIKTREFFREIVGGYLFQSQILKRFYEKPRGYAGDYLMFEMMYDAKPLSKGLGIYFDHYVFRHPIVKSVVNRKRRMKKILRQAIREYEGKSLKMLNIGCGGAREIRELFSENEFPCTIDYTFMDQDKEGLGFAKEKIKVIKNKNLKFHFVRKNALEMIGLSQKPIDVDSYEVIYSLGIVDYFLDNVFSRFIRRCYDLLKPNGKLIIAACSNRDMSIYLALRWLCEWNFYYREAEKVKALVREIIDNPRVEVNWEDNKKIFFITIVKN